MTPTNPTTSMLLRRFLHILWLPSESDFDRVNSSPEVLCSESENTFDSGVEPTLQAFSRLLGVRWSIMSSSSSISFDRALETPVFEIDGGDCRTRSCISKS